MNTVQVELALGSDKTWNDAYAHPNRDRDLVSVRPEIIPPVEAGCLQNVIVDLRDVPLERLSEVAAGIVYRVAGVEVNARAILSQPEVLQALQADLAGIWVCLSEGAEKIPGLLAGGWRRLPRKTGVCVRSPSLGSVGSWSRVARTAGLPLRFVWETNGDGWNTVDVLTSLGGFAFATPPAILGIDPGSASEEQKDQLLTLVCSALRELGLRRPGVQLVACPACARTKVNLRRIADQVWEAIKGMDTDLCVAVMGCEVNGPGEARMADVGVACGRNMGLIFREGKVLRRVAEPEIAAAVVEEIQKIMNERLLERESRKE